MIKRVRFNIKEDEEEKKLTSKIPFGKKFKHTLDSDEEDDEVEDNKKYNLNVSDNLFDGEEEGNLRKDFGVLITPFNIKEELKEGHFDNQGMYIFRKNREEIKDNWLDNIDWVNIKEDKVEYSEGNIGNTENDEIDAGSCYLKLFELILPNETVKKAMQRLGKRESKNKFNKIKKNLKKESQISNLNEVEEKERKFKLNMLIELSDKILSSGDTDIYEKTYETIKHHVDQYKKQKDFQMDMFADN